MGEHNHSPCMTRVLLYVVCYPVLLLSLVHAWTFPSLFRRSKWVQFEPGTDQAEKDTYFLELALREAQKAYDAKEVPIGAVVVWNDTDNDRYRILSKAYNHVECYHDASAHAELLALRRAARTRQNWRLTNATLYSTLEPCVMCCASAQAFRIQRIVYGGDDLRLGAIRSHIRLLDTQHPYHTIANVTGGVLARPSQTLLRDFFRARRREKRTTKRSWFGVLWQWGKNRFQSLWRRR